MPFEVHAWKFVVPVVGTLFLVAACGGGGGGPAGNGCADDDLACHQNAARSSLQDFFLAPSATEGDAPSIARRAALAATEPDYARNSDPATCVQRNGVCLEPDFVNPNGDIEVITMPDSENPGSERDVIVTEGGVTQSSYRDLENDYPVDVVIPPRSSGNRQFVVNNLQGYSPESPEDFLDIPTGTGTFMIPSLDADGTTTATLHLWVNRDTPKSVGGENNYLAYGFWILDPVGTTSNDIPNIGAFVDGSNRSFGTDDVAAIAFPYESFAPLRGTATYTGGAEGLYHEEIPGASATDPVTSDFAAWTAAASLTATFRDPLVRDTIEGTISDFVGLPEGVPSPTVALASTPLPTLPESSTSVDGGFFSSDGGATATVEIGGADVAFAGDWGGKFYDDVGADGTTPANDYPGTVAGTFGLADTATADTYRTFLGIFYADLEE